MRTQEGCRRRALTVVITAATVLGASAVSAHALDTGVLPIGGWWTTTTTTGAPSPSSSSSTTTTTTSPPTTSTAPDTTIATLFPGATVPSSSTTTTTEASGSADTATTPVAGDGGAAEGKGSMPLDLAAMMNSVRRTRANNTKGLLAALAPLEQYGLDETHRAMVGFGRFPVAGAASWSDDWWLPRFGPGWRLHQGLDIFAAMGTPVRAPVDGRIRITNGGLGGLAVYVVQPNRTYWYMAHLSSVEPGIAEGVEVKTGDIVGHVGDSGNARGGPPHLHFEIHPSGGPAIPPKPVVDKFVSDALGRVPELLDTYAKAYVAGTQTTEPPIEAPDPDLISLTPRDAMLWATAVNPAGGTFQLVESDARDALARIDWSAEAAATAHDAEQRADVLRWLVPVVPAPLARLL